MIWSDVTLGGLSLVADPDADGVLWRCPMSTIQGWWSSPGPMVETAQRVHGHGVWVGESWLPARAITLRGWCEADDRAAVQAAVDRLHGAAALTDTVLTIADSGQTLAATVRRSGEVAVRWVHHRLAQWTVPLLAADPRRLGPAIEASTGLPSTTGGLTIPFTIPFAVDAVVESGTVSLDNPGTIDGPVVLRIAGPVVAPSVTHINSGRSLVFATSLSLGAGEWIEVDMRRRTALAQGQEGASRASWITQDGWSSFEPGMNEWSFAATSGSGTLTVTASPAWM